MIYNREELEKRFENHCANTDDCSTCKAENLLCEMWNTNDAPDWLLCDTCKAIGVIGLDDSIRPHEESDVRDSVERTMIGAGKGVPCTSSNNVDRPDHYNGVECIDTMVSAFGIEAVREFCVCNAFKYLFRHKKKNGIEDLKKAKWYLDWLLEEVEDDG